MRVAVKPVVTTSVALVGASVIAVTPVTPSEPAARAVESDVSLSASSVAYIPVNMVQQALSAPANMVAAVDRLAAALAISGSWNENQPNNQWGWDEANPAMLMELINVLIPFPAFSEPWGRHLNWWATANLPMHEGCNYDCPDLPGMLDKMFKVPMSAFYSEQGYTFPEVRTPLNGVETPWSQQTVKLDPAEPLRSVWDSLTAEPSGVKTTTLWEAVTAFANLGAALQITGHVPDWLAVREIERFVKYFLRPPAEEQVTEVPDETDTPATATVPAGDNLISLTAEAVAADTVSTDTEAAETVSTSVVDQATESLKRKFALAKDAEPVSDTDAVDDTESTDISDAGEDPKSEADDEAPSTSAGSKHRKPSSESRKGSADAPSDTKADTKADAKDSGSAGSDSDKASASSAKSGSSDS
ncbi:hypothetical protein [Mycolicibacterium parafortuitum]|uniref:PE-PPE domain-containing protein n=1 Tax=Mycolicibacterium parafortuitum TaxID=39692 RepID=A0A375YMH9_MYCPF|nr:hypothetical protein [Mycolicibacterium parafortuitum]SRX82368.1 hypothetical protein MPP7335_04128 [Mycolicibacterium parafortuitum]